MDGTFTDVTVAAGLKDSGWGQGVCIGDYDNDGWEDMFITYYGKNRLFHNQEGVFSDSSHKSKRRWLRKAWELAVPLWITIATDCLIW
jgi:hypothetical protein